MSRLTDRLASRVGGRVQLGRGGPDLLIGRLVAVYHDYMVVLTDDGITYHVPLHHLKSIAIIDPVPSEDGERQGGGYANAEGAERQGAGDENVEGAESQGGGDANSEGAEPQGGADDNAEGAEQQGGADANSEGAQQQGGGDDNSEGTERQVGADDALATFNGFLASCKGRRLELYRHGPERAVGELIECGDDYLALRTDRGEVLYYPLFHIRSVRLDPPATSHGTHLPNLPPPPPPPKPKKPVKKHKKVHHRRKRHDPVEE